jgi:molybdopterin synthase sulfur carrier subunit
MRVRILYFASLREALGLGAEAVELPESVRSAGALRQWLAARGGVYAERFAPGQAVRCAVDQAMANDATPLPPDGEVAFFPPVTGG